MRLDLVDNSLGVYERQVSDADEAPSALKRRATALPIPCPEPVTIASFPSRSSHANYLASGSGFVLDNPTEQIAHRDSRPLRQSDRQDTLHGRRYVYDDLVNVDGYQGLPGLHYLPA